MRRNLTPWLLIAVVGLLASALLARHAVDEAVARANQSYELDRFGNPWFPQYREANAHIASLERVNRWLLWAGALPADLLLLVSALSDLTRRHRRWLAATALSAALLIAASLALAWVASAMPSGGMIG